MSIAYNNTTEQNIKFKETPIITHTNFNIQANKTMPLGTYVIEKSCEYLKLVCGLTVSDTSLTTDSYGAVCINYEIHYKDSDGNNQIILDGFYPKYKHENNNQSDFTIINAPGLIESISVSLINNEDIQVAVSDFRAFYAQPIDENALVDALNDIGGTYDLVIPLVTELPDPSDVPDGYICRLASL